MGDSETVPPDIYGRVIFLVSKVGVPFCVILLFFYLADKFGTAILDRLGAIAATNGTILNTLTNFCKKG